MIRCHAQQTNLHSDLTCQSRLAWLDRYEAKKRATMHSCSPISEWVRAEEYQLCRRCKGLVKGETKPAPKPKNAPISKEKSYRLPKAVIECTVCHEVKLTYAKGKCLQCYNRDYQRTGDWWIAKRKKAK